MPNPSEIANGVRHDRSSRGKGLSPSIVESRDQCTAGERGEHGAGRIERTSPDRGVAHAKS
jgi:hypothetical protein